MSGPPATRLFRRWRTSRTEAFWWCGRGPGQDGSLEGVVARRFASQGQALGPDLIVNTTLPGVQRNPAAACGADGGCVVVWQSIGQDGSSEGVYARRFGSDGAAAGAEFRVNSFTTGSQDEPAVARGPGGGFVVVWQGANQAGHVSGIFGQRYASGGAALGGEFHVGADTAAFQRFPAAAEDTDGGFVVAWQDAYIDGASFGIAAQRFDSRGQSMGGQLQVNAYATGTQLLPVVARQAAGRFLVAWSSYGQDGSNSGVFARSLQRRGGTLGPEFRVNSTTAGYQASPAVSNGVAGRFQVVWVSPDGSDRGIFGQRYGGGEGVPAIERGLLSLLAVGLAGAALLRTLRRRGRVGRRQRG